MMAAVLELTPALGSGAACRALGLWRGAPARQRVQARRAAFVGSRCQRAARPSPPLALGRGRRSVLLLDTLNSERFADTAPAAVHATLLDEGRLLGSVRPMYRVLAARADALAIDQRAGSAVAIDGQLGDLPADVGQQLVIATQRALGSAAIESRKSIGFAVHRCSSAPAQALGRRPSLAISWQQGRARNPLFLGPLRHRFLGISFSSVFLPSTRCQLGDFGACGCKAGGRHHRLASRHSHQRALAFELAPLKQQAGGNAFLTGHQRQLMPARRFAGRAQTFLRGTSAYGAGPS